uniref:FERM domain-containing protein 8 n=1 Tax=Rhipicephalus appendiculatus TaxID=34631 RepID=A0A131YJD7_RHIAP
MDSAEEELVQRRARLVSMRDLVPEDSSSGSSSEDEESSSMMKHHLQQQQQQQPEHHQGPCENYMTHNCVTIIPVEYPRSDSSPLSEQEMCVYLMNKVCLCVEVGNVQLATAHEIIDIIAEDDTEINFPAQVKDIFALWMTSPLLELQLKPDHRPYLIRERWSEYLKKYTFATKQQLDSDEPVLTLQRNVFLEKSKEKEITDLKLLKMLFAEAKGNVLDGRYPCETEDCMVLGAIQARLELGPYDPLKHTPEFFRSRIRDFLPEHACRSHWFLLGLGAKNGPERRLSEHYKAIASNVKDSRLMRKYLEFCWAFPYYGSAFFSGQVERPVTGIAALMNHYDLPVLVAINRDGIHVMDPSQPVVLLSLPYKQLSWDYACPTQPDNPDCLPCLFLQFQLPGQNETSVLQIFSRQAILMDALISTIVDELKKRASWIESEADTMAVNSRADDDIQVPLTVKKLRQEQGLSGRLRKLSIAKFNSSGDYLNSKGSLEFRRDDRPR